MIGVTVLQLKDLEEQVIRSDMSCVHINLYELGSVF